MRSELAHDIFRQDFANIYEQQNRARAELKTEAADVMREMMDALNSGTMVSPEIEKRMEELSRRLQNTKGKKVYGYLKRDVKNLIDQIVDELEKDGRVSALYQAWGKWNNEILLTYQKDAPLLLLLSRQPQFKSIKNMVIAEALKLGSHHFSFEDEGMPDSVCVPNEILIPEMSAEENVSEWQEQEDVSTEQNSRNFRNARSGSEQKWWGKNYKKARQYLYGSVENKPDFTKAFRLFLQEAEAGNALAMHDLGRMFADGLGREIDMDASQEWYGRALAAFHAEEQVAEERQRPYLQYRIGKMYAAGLGTDLSYESAVKWFSQAAEANHKYAQYSLAGLYCRRQGVEQDYTRAFRLYQSSAKQGNPYASYELAKMYRDGIGIAKDSEAAEQHFREAFTGFSELEKDSHNDKLQYRLGQMLYTGTGTERDNEAAAKYWQSAAKLGNVNAQYALGKLWLENGTGDPKQADLWLTEAAEGGNANAQHALGKMYRDGEHVEKNPEKAAELFTQAAGQKHEYAAYALGKMYLSGDGIPKDIEQAVRWLQAAVEQNNSYAAYTLGKLNLDGEDISKDIEKAIRLLENSAGQENPYAAYQLGKLYLTGEDVPKDVEAAIRWLAQSAEQENQFAQYALGKLHLCGHDVPRDKEKAIPLLMASAAQGNIYAQFLLEHLDSFRDPSVFLAATRLMHRLENLFREDYKNASGASPFHIDRKRRRRLAEKKQAQGHKRDDQEPMQPYTYG